MDPQNNNSFGSLQAPSNDAVDGAPQVPPTNGVVNDAGGVTGGEAIVSGGATAVDSDNYVSSEFPKSGLSINNGDGRSHKGLIIGLIVVFVLLIGGGLVALAAMNGVFGGGNNENNGGTSQVIGVSSLKEAFNSYVNYVANGEESVADVTNEEMVNLSFPYFLQINVDERSDYLRKVGKKFDALAGYLNGNYEIELSDMDLYFGWLAKTYPIDFYDAEKIYLANGYERAQEIVNEHFEIDVADPVFEAYVDAARDLALFELEIVSKADEAGCVVDGVIKKNCYTMTEEENNSYNQKAVARNDDEVLLRDNAVNAADVIYGYVYNVNGGDNE